MGALDAEIIILGDVLFKKLDTHRGSTKNVVFYADIDVFLARKPGKSRPSLTINSFSDSKMSTAGAQTASSGSLPGRGPPRPRGSKGRGRGPSE